MTSSQGLMLVNDLIKGTKCQEELIKWKKQHKLYHKEDTNLGTVGNNYWQGFLKRHYHSLRTKTVSGYAID